MKEKNHDHQADDNRFLDQVVAQRGNRVLNKSRTIVSVANFDSFGKADAQIRDLEFDAVDDVKCDLTKPHLQNPYDRLNLAFPMRESFALVDSLTYHTEYAHKHCGA